MPGETNVIQQRVRLTDNIPIRCKPYPLPYATRPYPLPYATRKENEVDSMLEMRVVRPSTSPYTSPIAMVKDDSNRVCVDF